MYPQRLYSLGARKIVMFEIGPIGCIPSITRKHKHDGQCVEETNQIVSFFNQRLPALLKYLTSTLQGSTFVLGQANFLGYDAIRNPSKYGKIIVFLLIKHSYFIELHSNLDNNCLMVYRIDGLKKPLLHYMAKWDFRVHSIIGVVPSSI